MKRTACNLLVILALLMTSVSVASASPAAIGSLDLDTPITFSKGSSNVYVVQLLEDPVVDYKGNIVGYAATEVKNGQKINKHDPNVVRYAAYLDQRHTDVLNTVGGNKLYDYRYTYNGFAAELSPEQAEALESVAGVLAVTRDELHHADTSSTPGFLGLDAPGGLWEQLGGSSCSGEKIVIGIIDSGIWPESASFADNGDSAVDSGDGNNGNGNDRNGNNGGGNGHCDTAYVDAVGWTGACVPGEAFAEENCNNKLIGARHFNAAWGGDAAMEALRPWEFTSPRDYNGHGTHTASTAGGNHGVMPTGPGAVFGPISGMAPRAHIAVYKALWSTVDAATASGQTSDLVAAIDQAVADGVDVINYSVSGTSSNFLDPVEVSFLFAADAGIFVAASAGNAGTPGSVAHPSPWITTVAAGTHNRAGNGSVTLGNNATYLGASVAAAVGPVSLIDSAAAALPGAPADRVALCYSATDNGGAPVLDPALVTGKIVICDRGVTGRVNKSLAVQQAGGVGMILVNTSANSINADLHFVPTVHLPHTDRPAIKAYAATPGATATINASTVVYNAAAPFTAAFSSRGPLVAGGGDLLKPDLIAPGQDILAAVAPPGQNNLEFNTLSGTSMSSPHVAGLAALLKELHWDWTPMMIKSALMTTGYDVLDGPNTTPSVIFSHGAGHVRPNLAADPGLVYNSGFNDWLAFLCGATTGVNAATCSALQGAGYSLDPSNMNLASIAIGDLAGTQTVVRNVTNVSSKKATFTASVTGLPGITVSVNPSSLTLKKGETKTFTVTFTRTDAALNSYVGGYLTWNDGQHAVRSPLVVRPVALAAPAQVTGNGGPLTYNVKFGYNGPFTAAPRGLVPAVITTGEVFDDPTDSTCSLASPNAQLIPVTIAAGTTYARFSLFDLDVAPGSDIDLCVFRGATQVGGSGSGTSAEEVNLLNPVAASYTVVVQGWGVAGSSPFKLHSWLLGSGAAGNITVSAPTSASIGATGAINLTFSGLAPATKYLGSVAYSGIAGLPNPTIVRVDMP